MADNVPNPNDLDKEGFGDTIALATVSLTMALRGLSANKMRAFLTMLGVIIGVGAVIIAISIGQGSKDAVTASLSKLGTNVLTVQPGQQRSGGISFGAGSKSTLVIADADAILRDCPAVAHVSPQVNKTAQVKFGDQNTNTTIYGTSEFYPVISNHPVQSGRYLTAEDIKSNKRVAVVGSGVASTLFNTDDPVGRTIQISGQNFLVVGALASKGGQGFRNPDDGVYVPVSTAMRRLFGMVNVQTITCQALNDQVMAEAQTEISAELRKEHRLTDADPDDFSIFNQADLVQTASAQQDTFASLISYLAVVSLVVGGIGIMNIMLVSVTERTREIGVRKAIGARRADILTQFLLEALLLSLVGGFLGVVVGVGGGEFIQIHNNWTVSFSIQTVIMAFSFSAFVGVFFGFYPAYKAANLNPIEALRYE